MNRVVIIVGVLGLMLVVLLMWPRTEVEPPNVPLATNAPEIAPVSTSTTVVARLVMSAPLPAAIPSTNTAVAETNFLKRLLSEGHEPPTITREQAEAFAAANGRRADALLAAWRASGDAGFLREAMTRFPNDPRVAFMAWAKGGLEDSPERSAPAKREWLMKLQQAAPDNALADYLLARAHFKDGDADSALRDLAAASHKPWRDYTADAIQNTEEAYRSAGYSDAEAKAIATMSALLPHFSELRATGKSLMELAATRREAGDTASSDAALQWALQLGQRTAQEGQMTLLQQLVAVAIQADALKKFDPNTQLADGRTAEQFMAELQKRREVLKGVARDSGEIMPRLSEADLGIYFDRLKVLGEESAVQWAKGKVAPK
jgi:hypothetical protein